MAASEIKLSVSGRVAGGQTGRLGHGQRSGGPPEADISHITAASPPPGFHPMAPLGGKESTQRCHWGETRIPPDALRQRTGPPRQDRKPGKPSDTPPATENGTSSQTTCIRREPQSESTGARNGDGRGWCYRSEHSEPPPADGPSVTWHGLPRNPRTKYHNRRLYDGAAISPQKIHYQEIRAHAATDGAGIIGASADGADGLPGTQPDMRRKSRAKQHNQR
jgi:hypothetical protein